MASVAHERSKIPADLVQPTPSFTEEERVAAREFYDAEGYVVVRGLLAPEQCDKVMAQFNREVRHSPIPILRQKNMRYETNAFTQDGFLANPIFNVQDLQTARFAAFKHAVLDVLTNARVAEITAFLLRGEQAKVIQSMFFEAPAGTWAHQDSYYQDSAAGLGQAVAGWFALEDIDEGAGRFFVCPRSHHAPNVLRNEGSYNFAAGHEAYKQAIVELLEAKGLPVVAPALKKGDVLLWNSLTIHGSFCAARPGVSRRSLTAHYLREQDEMLQFHTRVRRQTLATWNGMHVGLLHDQDRRGNRLVRDFAHKFPGSYMTVRKLALQTLLATRKVQTGRK